MHGEEEPGNSLMSTSFNFAFAPLSAGGAGLDFVGLVDHNNNINRGEIGRYQGDYPGKLIIPGTEVTTYKGHYNNLGSSTFADFRGGPIYQRKSNGDLEKVTDGIAPASQFGPIQASGGWTQINHPTVIGGSVCRGCPWDYTDAETDYSKVDAIEVQNGAADFGQPPNVIPSPFTATAIAFYQRALATGAHIAAVGSSDAHKTNEPGAVIGRATTVVGATDLSRAAIVQGIRADRTYVKLYGNDGPDIRVTARSPGDTFKTLGDTLVGPDAHFDVHVLHAGASAARPGSYDRAAAARRDRGRLDAGHERRLRDHLRRRRGRALLDRGDREPRPEGTGSRSTRARSGSRPVPRSSSASSSATRRTGRRSSRSTACAVPGELRLTGKGLKSKTLAGGPGSAKLKLKPKGKPKKKLRKKGKAKVKVAVGFAPQGGEPAQLSEKLKLKRKRKHHKHGHR